MIKPTVGRVVWFHPNEEKEGIPADTNAAIITHVWGDEMVNLVVFSPNGESRGETSVWLWQGEDATIPRPSARYCEWMPYQVGQARRDVERVFT